MCGRYSLAAPDPAALRARFGLHEEFEIRPRFNVAPGSEVLAVLGGEGEPEGALLRWGLVPHWAEKMSGGRPLINARAETVSSKPAFRDAFRRHRCLVIADGFYEWQPTGTGKQPYWIARADHAPFAFAGLWAPPADPAPGALATCAILTTTANEVVAPIHARMPVILEPGAEGLWLAPTDDPGSLLSCLGPFPAHLTAARPVSRAVNDARCDDERCIGPAGLDGGDTATLF